MTPRNETETARPIDRPTDRQTRLDDDAFSLLPPHNATQFPHPPSDGGFKPPLQYKRPPSRNCSLLSGMAARTTYKRGRIWWSPNTSSLNAFFVRAEGERGSSLKLNKIRRKMLSKPSQSKMHARLYYSMSVNQP